MFTPKLDKFPLFMMLSIRYNPTYRGIIKGTKVIPDTQSLRPANFTDKNMTYEFCVNNTEKLLRENISKISAKNVAIGLSGGTDSSLNSLLLAKNEKVSLKLFCIGFNDSDDEFSDARLVANLTNCDYKEIVLDDVTKDLPTLVWKFGSPKSNLWPYYNFKTVRELGAKTTLSGEGGDELFGGYYFRYVKYLKSKPLTSFFRAKKYVFSRPRDFVQNQLRMFGPKFKKDGKLVYTNDDIIKFFEPTFSNNLPFIKQIFLADFNYKLRFDFNYVDLIFAKSEGVKVFSPFLEKNMLDFAPHIPTKFKITSNTSKIILRDILKRLGAPKRIYEKPKQGWGMRPTIVWERGLRERCENFLLDGYLVRDDWINKKWIKDSLNKISSSNESEIIYPIINKLWDLLSFEVFYIQYVLQQSKKGRISNWN
ncbi:asparagine synthase C-terminal domain-containing protein [Candidatus Nitrosotenuis uzonensis]|uniref:Asparagine synthase (Glutamine-hydrolyzing) n=1 Tax=Candidatus Nitrosotenuis uzonensis TaxID=1407055 RepID=V6AV51_9ARCH|nr:asparagine synthase C-terminal domain-containing protein [Candidatus Nitrosotenuis uzonensis]CDI06470.1 putative Asparagine synthase (Glutamine-hydrolyzing) [Candidatus Nitrosotenuis uzonensis]